MPILDSFWVELMEISQREAAMKRKCVLYMWGLASAIVAFLILEELVGVALGRHGGIVAGMILGLSPGSVLGIVLAERIIYKEERWNIRSIIQALLFGIGGLLIGSWLLEVGGLLVWFVPIVVVLMCLYGYHFKKASRNSNNHL
jgi:hypothetical protein